MTTSGNTSARTTRTVGTLVGTLVGTPEHGQLQTKTKKGETELFPNSDIRTGFSTFKIPHPLDFTKNTPVLNFCLRGNTYARGNSVDKGIHGAADAGFMAAGA